QDHEKLKAELAKFRRREPHALVKRGVDLADKGLTDLNGSPEGDHQMTEYMWTHEREAVRWVELRKTEVARLAADVVLLSNMTYRLRSENHAKAEDRKSVV